MTEKSSAAEPAPAIPPDDLRRNLTIASAETGVHIGLAGDTYTVLLTGQDTAGRFSLIGMYIPPGGGPPPHRHDFEETFTILEGELELSFRGQKQVVRPGETAHVPANAPHHFHNSSGKPVRLLCICSPAGQEKFFMEVGISVASPTTPPPPLDEAAQAGLRAKAEALAAKYRTEFLPPA